jgi:hypothetical protein
MTTERDLHSDDIGASERARQRAKRDEKNGPAKKSKQK